MVLVKSWPFPNFFFSAILAKAMCFTIFQNKETPFQAIKTKSSKSRKNSPNCLVHGFGQKLAIFPFYYFRTCRQGECLLRYSRTKNGLSRLKKTRSSKSRKIDIFPKELTHGFGPKMAIFPTFFFLGNIGQENVFYDILERKNAFLGHKNKKFKKSKN